MAPKVFVSHASEDKARFVLGFAERLRARGIDAWLDRWEMQPGENLVEQVFEEGLKEAAAVIIVLSRVSVAKPWVREELSAAVIKRIDTGSRLIPVVIDDCEVPEALRSTVWERIEDLASYDASLDRIVAAIYGIPARPPLGEPPAFATADAAVNAAAASPTATSVNPSGPADVLDVVERALLRRSCEEVLAAADPLLHAEDDALPERVPGFTAAQLMEALDVLEEDGLVETERVAGGLIIAYRVTHAGMESHAARELPGYEGLVRRVAAALVNEGHRSCEALATALGERPVLVAHILDRLESQGLVQQERWGGAERIIHDTSPRLRRLLD